MTSLAASLVAASAAIPVALGLAHLAFTFHGPKLLPRDASLQARMAEVSPVITRQTTVWRCWIGFNASHSLGLVLFGAVYGHLALSSEAVLFGSPFLLALGLLALLAWAALSWRYFFRTPLRAMGLAMALYLGGVITGLL